MYLFRHFLFVLAVLKWHWSFSTAACSVTRREGILNLGINAGGCFKCSTNNGALASGEELEELCKQTCLADSQCKMYETAQPSIGPFFESVGPNFAINCCIEHVNLVNSPVFMNAAEMTDHHWRDCKKEVECWSSSVLSDDCIKDQTRSSQCVLEPSNFYVHSNPNNILDHINDGCAFDEASINQARDAAMCSSDLTFFEYGVCSPMWCTSPNGRGGYNCWAGTPNEPCTCSKGKAKETGRSVVWDVDGKTYYEYVCCTDGSGTGEQCGEYVVSTPYLSGECRSDICTDIGGDCCAPSGEARGCSLPRYSVYDGGTSSYSICWIHGSSAVYQCCLSQPSSGITSNGLHSIIFAGMVAFMLI